MTEAPLAEPGQRLLARIVDTLVVGVPVIIVVREFVSAPSVDVVAPPAVAGCMLLYEALQLALWGRTLGKRFAGIEVVVPGVTPVPGAAEAKAHDGDTAGTTFPSWVPGAETRSEATTAAIAWPGSPRDAEANSARDRDLETEHGRQPGIESPQSPNVGPMPMPGSEAGPRPHAGPEEKQRPEAESMPDAGAVSVPVGPRPRLGVVRAVVRAAVYSLPIAARPIPVAGVLASIFWVTNAGALYEGTLRQAVHDRLTGTVVVKRSPTDSSAF